MCPNLFTMASPEAQLRKDFKAQMAAAHVPGSSTSVGELIGCVYCLLDFDGQPLYVGKSTGANERLGARISRHILGQRSDAAGRCFPPYEVHSINVFPLRNPQTAQGGVTKLEAQRVSRAEGQIYAQLAKGLAPPLNETVPTQTTSRIQLPKPIVVRCTSDQSLIDILWDHDLRVERWVDVIKVMANRVRTGGGTPRQREILKLQIERLASLA